MSNKLVARETNRRDYLREYLVACVHDNVLSWSDFATLNIVDKVLRAISSDVRVVVKDLLRDGAKNGLSLIGNWLSSRGKR